MTAQPDVDDLSPADRGAVRSVGIVGLGAMGMRMARTLLARGFAVRGYARSPVQRDHFRAAGGIAVASAREAAAGVNLLLVVVVNAAQAEQVLFEQGALDALAEDGIVMLCADLSAGAGGAARPPCAGEWPPLPRCAAVGRHGPAPRPGP